MSVYKWSVIFRSFFFPMNVIYDIHNKEMKNINS